MQRFILQFSISLLALIVPVVANAVPPTNVTDLHADFRDGNQLVVGWEKLDQDDIAYYRIYYSRQSILQNNGSYDDFEQTDGPKSRYTFDKNPGGKELYIAVLAVNNAGEESPIFTEEISIDLSSLISPDSDTSDETQTSTNPTFNVPDPNQDSGLDGPAQTNVGKQNLSNAQNTEDDGNRFAGRLHLLAAEAISATGIVLTMSQGVTISAEDAPTAFRIIKADDTELRIKRLIIEGAKITVFTTEQEREVIYEMLLSEPLEGSKGEPLDTENRKIFFTGHPTGIEPVEAEVPVPQDPQSIMNPQDVSGFTINATESTNGLYKVEARWDIKEISGGLAEYVVHQSLDGGQTFSEPQLVPADVNGVDIAGVKPGAFGLVVQTINTHGYASEGVFQNIDVAGSGNNLPPVRGNLIQPPPPPPAKITSIVQTPPPKSKPPVPVGANTLPQSGAAFVLFTLIFAGIIVGWKQAGSLSRKGA